MRARFPLLLLLGILFLAAVSLTYGEKENPCVGGGRCRRQYQPRQEEEEDEEWRGGRRGQDPEERERVRQREERQRRQERQKEERHRRSEKEEQQQERGRGQSSQSQRSSRNNPFYFPRSRFQTLYRSEQGRVRILQRFDSRSNKLENLQNYRIVEFEAKPNSIVLPHHSDAEYILVVQEGEATVHLANPNDRESYNLERGDALRIPAGTTSYIVNRNDNQNLRIVKLAIPINKPGKFDDFFPASNEDQQSYFRGFSRNILEAAFNVPFEEIERTLLEGNEDQEGQQQEQHHQRSQENEGVIVRVSKEQIQELTRHAKSSSRRGPPSQSSGPFNLRSRRPIYESNFGRFFEVTPDRNPQLEDLGIFLSCVEIKEGGLMLPHYNSKAIVVLVVTQGKARLELVALRDENQQQQQEEEDEEEEEEEEGNKRVHRYSARLSQGDVFVIPAGHPVAINASSDFHLLAFGINAENNQRNFLAGENDNVLNQLQRLVKHLAFPGSGEQVERLFKNQRESYFVSAQPQQRQSVKQEQQREEEGRRGPLLSILGAFN